MEFKLVQDEPTSFLDHRKNPVKGRHLTFTLADGTMVELDVTSADYQNQAKVLEKLQTQIDAHNALLALGS